MSRHFFSILLVLILLGGGVYFWWNRQPTQQIGRQVDHLLEAISYQKLSLKKTENRHQALRKIFPEEVSFTGKSYFPNQRLSLAEILSRMDEFHGMITLCELTEKERLISLIDDSAVVTLNLKVKVASGPNFKQTQLWKVTLHFEKLDQGWKIVRMEGEPKEPSA